MFDELIKLELKSIFFSKEYVNIMVTTIISVMLMFILYQLPNKDWLIFFTGILIIWERILLLKIRRIQSAK
ncbi:hypothetical protein B9N40_26270 [Escherichia coli]|jgi:hypothetical protein|nr:hypothetical protein BE932_00020 [Escherichia coli]RBT71909.1 hypothetical protein B9N40_26270 [Escherichia coli]